MSLEVFAAALRGFALSSADGTWEVLSLLDQYHRRGVLTDTIFRALKTQLMQATFSRVRSVSMNAVHATTQTVTKPRQVAADHLRYNEPAQIGGRRNISMHDAHADYEDDDINQPLLVAEDFYDEPLVDAIGTPQTTEIPPFIALESAATKSQVAAPIETTAEIPASSFKAAAAEPAEPPKSTAERMSSTEIRRAPPSPPCSSDVPLATASCLTKQIALSLSLTPGKLLADRFTIESALAYGRTSAVFRARDRFQISQYRTGEYETEQSNNFVALKVLLVPTDVTRAQFFHEQCIAHFLSNPQFIKSSEMHQEDALLFFCMELIEGQTLSELLESTSRQRGKVLTLVTQLAESLKNLHDKNIVHGDINPENVMLANKNKIRLIDYGAARNIRERPISATAKPFAVTNSTPAASMPEYASCERLAGQALQPDDDIFSLSCIAYQLLTGKHPFKRLSAMEARSTNLLPARIPELRPYQWQALQHGLAWNHDDRIASIDEWLAIFSGTKAMKLDQPVSSPTSTPEPVVAAAVSEKIMAPRHTTPDVSRWSSSPFAASTQRRWPIALVATLFIAMVVAFIESDPGKQLRTRMAALADSINIPAESRADTAVATIRPGESNLDANTSDGLIDKTDQPLVATVSPVTTQPFNKQATSAYDEHSESGTEMTPALAHTAATSLNSSVEVKEMLNKASVATNEENSKPAAVAEAHGKIGFSKNTFIVSKRDSYAPITINRDDGTAGKVTFSWWTESDSAKEGADFMSYGRKTEVLGNGKRRMTVFVPIVPSIDKSSGRAFYVNIGNTSNGLLPGAITRAKVIIAEQ